MDDFLSFSQTLRLAHGIVLLTGLYFGLGYVWWLNRQTHRDTNHEGHAHS